MKPIPEIEIVNRHADLPYQEPESIFKLQDVRVGNHALFFFIDRKQSTP